MQSSRLQRCLPSLFVYVTVNGRTLKLKSVITYPKTGKAPYPLMIGTSMLALPRQLFADRPIAIMNFHEKQVNDYGQWGLSRILDGLQQLGPEITKIDMSHIGVSGCSYAGKMALYCGAFDERVALTIAQEPGGGGAAAWRASRESTKAGKNLEDIDKTDYHWFLESQFPEVQAFIDKFLLGKNTDTKNIEKSDLN